MAWKEVQGLDIWIPHNEGDILEGKVLKLDNDAKYGLQATVKKADGSEIFTPSHAWLQNLLKRVKVGDLIQVEYLGDDPPAVKGHSPTKKYALRIDG